MKCPLCESTEFQDCGKTVAGDRKYRCEICQDFFDSRIFNNAQRSKLRLPEINFLSAVSDRLQQNQDDQDISSHPFISKLITITEPYLVRGKVIIAIALLYQIGLVVMTAHHIMANHAGISWEDALQRFGYNDAHHYIFLSKHGYQSTGEGIEFIVFFPFYT